MKNVYTLVSDIYKLMETKEVAEGVDSEAAIDLFGENVKDLMRNEFGGRKRDASYACQTLGARTATCGTSTTT